MALLVGKKAPSFTAAAVVDGDKMVDSFSLEQFIGKQEVVLFFYPKDFTYVCPTELLKLQESLSAFEQRGVAVVACSTDTQETHYAWLNAPRERGGIQGVTYPLIADDTKTIASNFGVLAGDWSVDEQGMLFFQGEPIAYRGTFLIDKKGIVRHQSINDFALGRNIHEILRIIDMLHHTEEYGSVCPVNWTKGDEDLAPTPQGVVAYLSSVHDEQSRCGSKRCECRCRG